jgi:DNA recombination protein RmuC
MDPLTMLVFLVIAAAAFATGVRVGRGAANAAGADRQSAVDAAVRVVLAERGATAAAVVSDREHTVTTAVDTAVKVAGSALDARLRAGSQHIDVRAQAFEQRAQDISGELKRISDLVGTLQKERAHQHGEVLHRLEQTATAAAALQQTTQGLRDVLASPKSRGQWGERMAEDVLRAAGFVEGVNYRQQATTTAGRRPDFTFLLPHGLELNMDVKFPIDNYVRYLDAITDLERDAASGAFLRDVRARVKEITGREYIDAARTVDHVLLFIPNESIYTFIHQNDADLLDKALEQRVVLCSPSTLFAVLAVVRHAMRNFLFERTSDEILECLTRFVKQWDKFSDSVDKVGRHLGSLSTAFDDLNGTRRRQLEKELDRIEVLRSHDDNAGADLHRGVDTPVQPGDATDWAAVRALRAG